MQNGRSSEESLGDQDDRVAALERRVRDLETELAASRERLTWLEDRSDAWIASVSHDLRSPLTLVLGYAQASLRRLPSGPEAERARRELEQIASGARRLDKMIGQIVDDARLDLGHLHLDVRAFELGPLISEEVRRHRRLAVEHRFRTDIPDDLPRAWGDPRRVAQIVAILLSNATIFSPASSTVVVRVRSVIDHVQVTVADSGFGILPDERAGLFDRGYRSERLREARREGLGLSLSIAKRIATLLGADLNAESPGVDQGATFCLTLPVAAADETDE